MKWKLLNTKVKHLQQIKEVSWAAIQASPYGWDLEMHENNNIWAIDVIEPIKAKGVRPIIFVQRKDGALLLRVDLG